MLYQVVKFIACRLFVRSEVRNDRFEPQDDRFEVQDDHPVVQNKKVILEIDFYLPHRLIYLPVCNGL
ncbi:MAG: hypothetical protein PHI48_01910 [Bacteroidales bacterium]|nr:hypothetical protein [Bacteroidales bacterium]